MREAEGRAQSRGGPNVLCVYTLKTTDNNKRHSQKPARTPTTRFTRADELLRTPGQTVEDMHFEKPSKEKPCCTLPTVKKLLEQKRKRETSSVPPSCVHSSPVPSSTYSTHLSAGESVNCPGGSSAYSDMAVSYDMWTPSDESTYGYCQQGPSYSVAYNLPMATEYPTLSHLQTFGSTQSQTYQESSMTMADSCLSPSWSVSAEMDTSQSTHFYGAPPDANKLEEARMLIHGMDYGRSTEQDEDGDTILHIYTAKGLRECAYAAAERLGPLGLDAKEHKGKTALLVAVTANHPEIVHDLLSLGADINACDVNGQTALHLAAHYGYCMVLQALLSRTPPANLEARNFDGMTTLHCAVISHCATMKALSTGALTDASLQSKAKEKLLCVQMLLRAGASPISQEIKSNKTVLHLAVKEGNIDLVRFLLQIHMAKMKEFVNMKAHGHTALHMAAGLHGNQYQREMLQLLLTHGADPSIRNLENDQAAHLLQSGLEGEQLKVLLKKRNTSSRRRALSSQDLE